MILKNIISVKKNMNIAVYSEGFRVLHSYQTKVAVECPDGTIYITSTKHSKTTSRHIREFMGMSKKGYNAKLIEVYQNIIDCFDEWKPENLQVQVRVQVQLTHKRVVEMED